MATIFGKPDEILPQMEEMLSCGEGFWLTVTGNSMLPTLMHLKSRVFVAPFGGKAKRGDILLTKTANGHCLLHRVIKCSGDTLYYRGDALRKKEGPLPVSAVVGIVTQIENNGKIIPVDFGQKLRSVIQKNMTLLKHWLYAAPKKCGHLFHKKS